MEELEYKSFKCNPAALDAELNKHAKDGWRVVAASAYGSQNAEALVILVREKKAP